MVLGALSCGAELGPDAIEAELRAYLAAREIEPEAVRCPGSLPRERGRSVECAATIDGEEVSVVVEVEDDEGGLVLRPRHATLVTARLEPEIAAELRAQGQAVARVRCEGQVWVARPQAEHHCEITTEDGQHLRWRGVFSGEGSKHRATVTPVEHAAGGGR